MNGQLDQTVNLTAVLAKTPRKAFEIYPASYWASLIEPPKKTEFPGTGPKGNGINRSSRARTSSSASSSPASAVISSEAS